jgi:hypothetical protein
MAEVVSSRPLTTEARVSPYGICGAQSSTGTGFSPKYSVSLSMLLHHGFPCSYVTWEMNSRPGGSSSDTYSHPIDMTGLILNKHITLFLGKQSTVAVVNSCVRCNINLKHTVNGMLFFYIYKLLVLALICNIS